MGERMSDHMDMLMILLTLAGTAAVGGLASRYGVEQRPGFDERPEPSSHRYGLR
jgi:hypothetical protein